MATRDTFDFDPPIGVCGLDLKQKLKIHCKYARNLKLKQTFLLKFGLTRDYFEGGIGDLYRDAKHFIKEDNANFSENVQKV